MADRPVCELMRALPSSVLPDEAAAPALQRMRSEGVALLPVLDYGELLGLVYERDLARLRGELLGRRLVRDVMRGDPPVAPPWRSVDAVLRLMLTHRSEAVVISDRGHLVGLFTLDDAARRCGALLDAAALRH
ncbi:MULTISPECIES: CBS domain-containing protein [unclassified Nannocystis]|jgi:CBS domain-containing protein|nr:MULTISPECIES: CBS domain-containing protein [unclassified Nannocystis]MCY0985819.1 CBS domain-containing protein [Nannocystis sp. ILAH1]MCY1068454.1 CBS domain-containing protein [Nannocystis sp. RBIL2]